MIRINTTILGLFLLNFELHAEMPVKPTEAKHLSTVTYIHTSNPIFHDEIKKKAFYQGKKACGLKKQNDRLAEYHSEEERVTEIHHLSTQFKIKQI